MACKYLNRFINCFGDLSITGECELTGKRCDPIGAIECKHFEEVK